ncbi:nitroreductase/quinone reductase family protein [Streptomyces sp. SID13726]|uniref:nitroreductase/quinone reductase family protein n=1 Tax=Streptomyces sp. SID13726 TaxID=2706058 RepID=UPI0013BD8682|nr:nitroreductase family deazaflavin-dependent oxidoreductase [Streptomyces sp. SID13726]
MPHPVQDFNQSVIEEFRANHGRVGGPFEGGRLILLTTTGARTGTPHTTPVGYLPDGGDRILVIASAGGSSRHPDWYRNLVAHPQVTVDSGVFTYEARAEVLRDEARDQAFARAVEADRGWAAYQEKTDRIIPVVALHEIPRPGPPHINATSPGQALKAVHDAFRHELALIRREMATGGSTLGAQLRVNCLTFCQGLHNHHTGEGAGIFPFLADRHPESRPAIDRLHAEHEHIAALVEELRRTLAADDTTAVPAEVERLTTELEAHLTYEEEQLIPLLDRT